MADLYVCPKCGAPECEVDHFKAEPPVVAPRFCFSTDEENFRGDFDTREAALEAATEAFLDVCDEEPGYVGTVWTAEAHKPDRGCFLPSADELAERVLESMTETANAECGEHASEWPDVDAKEEKALGEILRAALDVWVADCCPQPDFCNCEAVKSHEVTVPKEATPNG